MNPIKFATFFAEVISGSAGVAVSAACHVINIPFIALDYVMCKEEVNEHSLSARKTFTTTGFFNASVRSMVTPPDQPSTNKKDFELYSSYSCIVSPLGSLANFVGWIASAAVTVTLFIPAFVVGLLLALFTCQGCEKASDNSSYRPASPR
jgi:hypothetical protein